MRMNVQEVPVLVVVLLVLLSQFKAGGPFSDFLVVRKTPFKKV